jgi:hypothetical protein
MHAGAARQPPGEQGGAPCVQIGLPGYLPIKRIKGLCGMQEERRGVAVAVLGKGCLGAEQLEARRLELVEFPHLGRRQQPACDVEHAGLQARLGGRQGSIGTPRGVLGQGHGPLQERGTGREAAPRLRPIRGVLQLHGNLFIRSGGSRSQMPRATVGIDVRIGDVRQGEMDRPPFLRLSRSVHRRPHERMAKCDALADCEQLFGRRIHRRSRDPESFGCAKHEDRIADRFRGANQQQTAGVLRQFLQLPDEALLDPPRDTLRLCHPEAARKLSSCQPPWQLEQRQRIALGLRNDPVAHPLIQAESHRRAQQVSSVAIRQAPNLEFGHLTKLLTRVTRCKHQHDRLRQQAPGDECKRQRGLVIEPLRIVHDAEQRALVRSLREQAQHRQPDQKAVRRVPIAHTEHDLERLALRRRKLLKPAE